MKIYNSIVSWIIKKRIHQIKLFINHPHEVQEELRVSLVEKAKNTDFGRTYDFNSIKNQQMPDREKLKKADYIISTDQTLDETKLEVKDVVSKIKLINPKAWNAFYKK